MHIFVKPLFTGGSAVKISGPTVRIRIVIACKILASEKVQKVEFKSWGGVEKTFFHPSRRGFFLNITPKLKTIELR